MKVVDIFCGAGIGAVGLKQMGFDIIYAVDNNKHAVNTYNNNIGNHAICADIRQIDVNTIPDSDIIIAGVPCLPFSFSGKGEGVKDVKHGDLIYHLFNIVEKKKPRYVIFENVKGIISKKHRHVFDEFVSRLEKIGYNVAWKLTNCIEYGIPQKRERVIIVASLEGLYEFPEATHALENSVSIRETIGDMPEPDEEHDFKNHYDWGIRNDEKPYVDLIPVGGNWRDLPVDMQMAFMGKSFFLGGGRTGYLRKIPFDRHALTITSTIQGKFNAQIVDLRDKKQDMNATGNRRFTVRECLRLQTVPDWFHFDDAVPLLKQYERCSGIPPKLIKTICENLK